VAATVLATAADISVIAVICSVCCADCEGARATAGKHERVSQTDAAARAAMA